MKSNKARALALSAAAVGVVATGGLAVAATSDDDVSASLAAKIDPSVPKNVILFIGDGMGDSEVTSGRYYGKGAAGRLNMDRMPFRGSSIHYVLSPGPGPSYAPNYTGDSAPTAVAWSTGKRTIDGRLAQGPSSAANVPGSNAGYETYMEIARQKGKATGNVSTAEITDATPAGPSAHISQRGCQGPADTRTTCPTEAKTATPAGLGSVAEQIVDTGYDVVLGGGRARWTQPLADGGSTNVLDYATSKGYTQQVGDKAGLSGITSLAGGKVLGLFNSSNMTTEFKPLYARTDAYLTAQKAAGTLDPKVNGGGEAVRCDETNRSSTNEPSLAELTKKAIDLLESNPKGFTLQVEGASIDKRDHAADACGQIGELLGLDAAVGVAQQFQKDHPDTLVIVTADHSHSSQIINAASKPATGSAYATMQTVDGAPIRIAYGTADTGNGTTTSGSQSHTGATVPVWASGPQAANIQGTIDQTDLFGVLNGKVPSKLATGGTPGRDGVDGGPGTPGTPGTPGAPGSAGAPGAPGSAGSPGAPGAPGAPGTSGVNGTNGSNGTNGINGGSGPAGPAGAPGTDGRDAQVTCKSSGSRTVKCTVSYGAKGSRSAARLVKSGRTVARGTVAKNGKLTLKASKRLTKGTYTLVARGQSTKLKLG